jgi:hypothetical protein
LAQKRIDTRMHDLNQIFDPNYQALPDKPLQSLPPGESWNLALEQCQTTSGDEPEEGDDDQ